MDYLIGIWDYQPRIRVPSHHWTRKFGVARRCRSCPEIPRFTKLPKMDSVSELQGSIYTPNRKLRWRSLSRGNLPSYLWKTSEWGGPCGMTNVWRPHFKRHQRFNMTWRLFPLIPGAWLLSVICTFCLGCDKVRHCDHSDLRHLHNSLHTLFILDPYFVT